MEALWGGGMSKPTITELQRLHAKACVDYANATHAEKSRMKFDVWYRSNQLETPRWETTSFVPMDELGVGQRGYFFRIRPEKKLRRWKPEEVPVGKVVVAKGYERIRKLITGVTDEGVYVNGCMMSFKATFDTYTLEDGSPCGVVD